MATTAINWIAADLQYASITDAAQSGLDILAADRTVMCLVKWTNNLAGQYVLAKGGYAAASTGYLIYVGSSGLVQVKLANGSSLVTVTSTTALTADTWQLVAVRFDRDGNLSISINGVDAGGAASIAALSGSIDSAFAFVVGAPYASTGSINYLNSPISDLAILDTLLTDAELLWIWNSGVPYKLNSWGISGTGGELLKQSLVSYWPLTSDLTDSHSTNDLTLGANPKVKPATYGSELVTNGTFAANTDGWSAVGSTLSSVEGGVSGNCLQVANSGTAYGRGRQTITTTAGVAYRLAVWHKNGTTTGEINVGTTAGGSDLYNGGAIDDANWAMKVIDFTATSTTSYLELVNATNTDTLTTLWDTVSVKAVTDAGLLNGGMDTWSSSTNAGSWAEITSGSSTITREDTVVYSGTNALALTIDAGGDKAAVQLATSLTSGKQYTPAIYTRSATGTPNIRYGTATTYNQEALTTSFAAKSTAFTADGTTFEISSVTASATVYVDSVTLTAASLTTTTGLDGADPLILTAVAKYQTLAAGNLTAALIAKAASKLAAIEAVVTPCTLPQPAVEWHKLDGATHIWPGPVDTAQWAHRDEWLHIFTDLHSGWYREGESAILRAAGVRATFLSQTWQWGNHTVVVGEMVDDGWDEDECWKAIPGSPGYYYPAVWNGELAERCLLRWADAVATLIPIMPDLYRIDLDAEVICDLWTTEVGTALGIVESDCTLLYWHQAARALLDAMGLSHVKLSTNPAALVLPSHDQCCGWTLIKGNVPAVVDSYIDAARVIMGTNQRPIIFCPHSAQVDAGVYRCHTDAEMRPFFNHARDKSVDGYGTWGWSWFDEATGEPFDGYEEMLEFLEGYAADPPRLNPNLRRWWMNNYQEDWWGEDEPGPPPGTKQSAHAGSAMSLGMGMG